MEDIVARVYQLHEGGREEDRPYLGVSQIGDPCLRRLFFSFRWVFERKFPGRILRLFDTGKREEERLIEELKKVGIDVVDRGVDGKQIEVVARNRHIRGHVDGVTSDPDAVIEFKTANDRRFKLLIRDGLRNANPEHFAQCQVYLGLMKLKFCHYLCVNKNTDDIYYNLVRFDEEYFDWYVLRAETLIKEREVPPVRFAPKSNECRFCDFSSACHGVKSFKGVRKHCRTCVNFDPRPDGTSVCLMDRSELSVEKQRVGCESHQFLRGLSDDADDKETHVSIL